VQKRHRSLLFRLALATLVCLGVFAFFGPALADDPPEPDPTAEESLPTEAVDEPAPTEEPEGQIELKNLSLPPGLKVLTGLVDSRLDRALTIQILEDGEPVAGRRVSFRLLSTPSKASGQSLSKLEGISDSEGKVETEFHAGSKAGDYLVSALYEGSVEVDPLQFQLDIRRRTWVMFLVFGLLGGLGIFLIGMDMAADGLKDAAGDRMRTILSALTSNRVIGLFIGVVATAILQSSSATTVMLVGFVSATMMNLQQAIGVMMGAKIGTTVTAQLIAFNIAEYSLLLVALGFGLQIMGGKKRAKQLGAILLGFGLIFFGLGIMGDAMRPLRTVPSFTELLVTLGDRPLLGIFVAVAFTAIVQSSAATIGLAIALCASGLLTLEAALPLAWGAHIGTCATALLSSLGAPRAGKQIAISHLIFSVAGVAVAFPFLGYFVEAARWLTALMGSTSVARELANGHMIFTIVTGILFLPFVSQMAWLTRRIMPAEQKEPPFGPIFLTDATLTLPVLALDQAQREILRMAGIVRGMMENSMEFLAKPTEEGLDILEREDDKVDILERSVRPFLATVGQGELEPELSAREHGFIYVAEELESIGDVISKEIGGAVRKLADREVAFSTEGLDELRQYHTKVLSKLNRVIEAFETGDHAKAEQTLQLGFKERILERRLHRTHLARLHNHRKETVETSAMHLTVLNNLRSIGEKVDNMARTILEEF
jgi:phosphate:Na+ symporter